MVQHIKKDLHVFKQYFHSVSSFVLSSDEDPHEALSEITTVNSEALASLNPLKAVGAGISQKCAL